MEHVDFFKKTLIAILDESPRGTKAKLADSLKINRINLSSYLAGRDNFSEQRKNEISKYFGFSPEEFLVLGMRLFHSDEPFLWALRAIYLDEQRFRDLVNESGISETRFKGIFNIGKSLPLMPEEKEKILEATGFKEDEFLDFGRREILKNPKMKWDLGGLTYQVYQGFSFSSKQAKPIESGLNPVDSPMNTSSIILPVLQENEAPEIPLLARELIDTLKQQVEDYKSEKEELKKEKNELKKEIAELKERIRSLEAQQAMTAEFDVKKSAS